MSKQSEKKKVKISVSSILLNIIHYFNHLEEEETGRFKG